MLHRASLTLAFSLSVACAACGTSTSIDATTESFAASVGQACASGHDCGSNQRCLESRCELLPNACLAHDACGSQRCDAGFCAMPSPAQLVNEQTTKVPSPSAYLKAGNDGLVDGRGGLVLALSDNLRRDGEVLRWHDFVIEGWVARTPAPQTWVPTRVDAASAPERFVLTHASSGSVMVAYARPLADAELAMAGEPLTSHAGRLEAALERGHGLADAVTLPTHTVEGYPLQNRRYDEGSVDIVDTVQMDGQRVIGGEAEKVRVHVGRFQFGNREFVLYVGLSAPSAQYAQMLDELAELAGQIKLGGVGAQVESGVQ